MSLAPACSKCGDAGKNHRVQIGDEWRCIPCISKLQDRIKELEKGIEVAVVVMTATDPEDYIRAFGNDRLNEMLVRNKPKEDFQVEDYMKALLDWERLI